MWDKKSRNRSPIRGMDRMVLVSTFPLSEVSSLSVLQAEFALEHLVIHFTEHVSII